MYTTNTKLRIPSGLKIEYDLNATDPSKPYKFSDPNGNVLWLRHWKAFEHRFARSWGHTELYHLYEEANKQILAQLAQEGRLHATVSIDTDIAPTQLDGTSYLQQVYMREHNNFARAHRWPNEWLLYHQDVRVVVKFSGLGSTDWTRRFPKMLTPNYLVCKPSPMVLTLPLRVLQRYKQGDKFVLEIQGFPIQFRCRQKEGSLPFEQTLQQLIYKTKTLNLSAIPDNSGESEVAILYVTPHIAHLISKKPSIWDEVMIQDLNQQLEYLFIPPRFYYRPGDIVVPCFMGYDDRSPIQPQREVDDDPYEKLYEDWSEAMPQHIAESRRLPRHLPYRCIKHLKEGDWLEIEINGRKVRFLAAQSRGWLRQWGGGRFEQAVQDTLTVSREQQQD